MHSDFALWHFATPPLGLLTKGNVKLLLCVGIVLSKYIAWDPPAAMKYGCSLTCLSGICDLIMSDSRQVSKLLVTLNGLLLQK